MNRHLIDYVNLQEHKIYKTEWHAESVVDALADFAQACKQRGHNDITLIGIRSYVKSKIIPTTEAV